MVALLREQLADMRQQRDHWQIEAADWKRQAQNLLPPPQPAPQQAATSEPHPQPSLQRQATGCCGRGAGCADRVRATMDEIGEHAWIISIVGDFLTLFGAYWADSSGRRNGLCVCTPY